MPDAWLTVKVRPQRSPSCCRGERDGRWLFDIAAAPEKGKANEELIRTLAELTGVARAAIEIASGATSGIKRVRVRGGDAAAIARALAQATK